ncbi:Gfo/Idh/MocA family oxidoreductase [Sinorhizobium fredii]|uniref:Gfo/Idh/MocA family oxidoreductase n=1 Tax=Rhizobium fredii TaxID=380 RepID=UPI000684DAF0|nr:Gfo/Idh/MocA family oxidoreductase [Sinorhizobium fredii]
MPNQLNSVVLAGCGGMAGAYAKVLRQIEQPFVVLGRSQTGAEKFAAEWGADVGHGPHEEQLAGLETVPAVAIVAVSAASLSEVTKALIKFGCRKILIEKPAAMNPAAVAELARFAEAHGAEAYVAYNRRFYSSVSQAERLIAEDGGALSLKFDFTEAARRIETIGKSAIELEGWFYGNSTHVLDLAFFLAGEPRELQAQSCGALEWHPAGAIFSGHGVTKHDAVFSYHANWLAPGRWGVEIMTRHRRLVLQPMEQLFCQNHNAFSLEQISLDDELDRVYKPGVYRQTKAFLTAEPDKRLLPLAKHASLFAIYATIRDGGVYSTSQGTTTE